MKLFKLPWLCKNEIKNTPHHNQLEKLMNFEINRRKKMPIIKDHPTRSMSLKDGIAEIDVDMMPMIEWLNGLKDTCTKFCCQGEVYNPEKNPSHIQPYIMWCCDDPITVKRIIKILHDFDKKSDSNNYCYHNIQTEISWHENNLRYTTRWFDNLALHDFIEWAGTHQLMTSHFRENYSHLMKAWHSYD